MKNYVKPMVMIMPLEGNEKLCGNCANKAGTINLSSPENAGIASEMDSFFGDGDGVLSREEVNMFFGATENCKASTGEVYCKFQFGQLVAFS